MTLTAKQTLKLCDFGSAKCLIRGEPNVAYICSRYYRAPELIFGAVDYTVAIDVWSASTLDNSLPTVQHLPNGQVRRMCPLSTDNTLSVPVLNYVDDDTVQRLKLPQFDQLTGQPADYEVLLNRMAASMKNTKYHPVAVRLKDKLIASGNLPKPETCLLSTFVPRQSAISRAAQQLSQSAATKARRVGHCIGFANLLTVAVLCGGLGLAASPFISGSLGLDVVHYCDRDPVHSQNSRTRSRDRAKIPGAAATARGPGKKAGALSSRPI